MGVASPQPHHQIVAKSGVSITFSGLIILSNNSQNSALLAVAVFLMAIKEETQKKQKKKEETRGVEVCEGPRHEATLAPPWGFRTTAVQVHRGCQPQRSHKLQCLESLLEFHHISKID